MKKSIIIILLLMGLLGCNNKKNSVERSMNTSIRSVKELEVLVLEKGDSSAYYTLRNQYFDYGYERFLPYALVMANRYDYSQAYFDVFDCLLLAYGTEWDDIALLDSASRNMAIEYLEKASKKGHSQAKEVLEDYANLGVLPKK